MDAFNRLASLLSWSCLPWALSLSAQSLDSWNFDFGANESPSGIAIDNPLPYDPVQGYGFAWMQSLKTVHRENSGSPAGLTSKHPFVFAVKTGEGNYQITARFTGPSQKNGLTIKAESRRLMVHVPALQLAAGEQREVRFITNVRTPLLAQGGSVHINEREAGVWHWDELLQLEFHSGAALTSLQIRRIDALPTLYLMGDSTMTDQTREPWIGWGQMLPFFFNPTIAIANHAESGETLRQFRQKGRLEKVMDTLKFGDFVMVQFGHNDMKERGEGIGAMQSYADDLRFFVTHIQGRGAQPILVTSMKRRRFDEEGKQYPSLLDYPLAVRKVAAEMGIPLVDLNLMSGVLYAALGPEGSKQAFVHYPAGTFSDQEQALKDDTHFNAYGGYELANCVAEALKNACPPLALHLRKDLPLFDPSSPHDPGSLRIPPSPQASVQTPHGN